MENKLEFHNPYHFVPIPDGSRENWKNADSFLTDTSGHWTHSRYVTEDGVHSGRIVCRLTTETPIFIGARKKEKKETEEIPATVFPFELGGSPAIPASSLRGLISSIAEAASNSSLRVLEDRHLSRRQSMREGLGAIGILKRNQQDETWEVLPIVLPPLSCHENGELKNISAGWKALFPTANLRVYIDGYDSDRNKIWQRKDSFLAENSPNSFSASHQDYWYMKLSPARWKDGKKDKLVVSGHHIKKIPSRNASPTCFLIGQKGEGGPISQHEYEALEESKKGAYTKGILRVLGIQDRESEIPSGKKHEIFIPLPRDIENNPRLPVDDALERFHKLAKQRTEADKSLPFTLQGMQRNKEGLVCLRENDLVFFNLVDDRSVHPQIKNIAISSIWRDEIPGTLFKYFSDNGKDNEIRPFHRDRRELISPAEMVFGFVEDRKRGEKISEQAKAYAGRVRFSHGLLEGDTAKPYMAPVTLKILDSPKPPCPAMYFTQRTGDSAYIPKKDLKVTDHRPQGRKFYLHHPYKEGTEPWKTKDPKENWKQKVSITPVKKDETFWFHVDFTNLNNYELGMLLYSLRPDDLRSDELRPDKKFRHKIGMGKPLGLGTVRIDPVLLHFINREARYSQFPEASSLRYFQTLQIEPDAVLPDRYQEMAKSPEQVDNLDKWTKEFIKSIPLSVEKALCLLGDREKIKHPVHTPLQKKQAEKKEDMEKETFKWFVENDKNTKKCLLPITEFTTELPTLEKN